MRPKRRRVIVPVSLLLLVATIWAGISMWPLVVLDGFEDTMWSAILWEDTLYAPGYTHRRFADVEAGMTEAQLVELLGSPLKKLPLEGGAEAWLYGQPASDTHHHVRAVHLVASRVVKRISFFYVD